VIDRRAPPTAPDLARARPDPSGVAARSGVVGVVAALPREAESVARKGLPFGRAIVAGPQMWVCLAGVGRTSAESACGLLLGAGATALVSWGIAAGLDPDVRSGALVITSDVLAAGAAGSALRLDAESSSRRWAADAAERVRHRMSVMPGPIAATDRVLTTVADKRALALTGAIAADMETAAVAEAAQSAGVPWIAVRAVADTADVALPPAVLGAVDGSGHLRPGRFMAALLSHPDELLRLPAVARGFRAALRSLRGARDALGPALMVPPAENGGRLPQHSALGTTR
jgi:adenosylhomocysteine nucleosidase